MHHSIDKIDAQIEFISVDGNKFTCIKSGTKLVWKKIGISSTSQVTDSAGPQKSYLWTSVCDLDPWVPAEWANYQKFALRNFGCARPYRFVDVALPTETPKSLISTEVATISVCKIPERPESQNIGFRQNGFQFSGDITIQVIPIQFNDFKAQGIDEIYCVSVNDAFVMNEWSRALKIKNVKVIPDGAGTFTEGMGMTVDMSDIGFGPRSRRYAAIVKDGMVEHMFAEPDSSGT